MGKEYQIDSNIIIDYLDNKIPSKGMEIVSQIVDANPNISVITKIEVLRFNTTETAYKILGSFIAICNSLIINDGVVDKTIEICKQHKIKLPDAIIAATALINDLTLVTRNTDDFKRITGLTVINPYDL